MILATSLIPVSYTHLDVYKRQTMIRARQIALNLNLNMKIGDVEYQGDGNKSVSYTHLDVYKRQT